MSFETTKEVLCTYLCSKIFHGLRNDYLIIEFTYGTLNYVEDAIVFTKDKMVNIQLLLS